MADTGSGFRYIPGLGNAQMNLSTTLSLAPGVTYYWSVQAIDTAFAGSRFAGEAIFFIPVTPLTVSVTGPAINPVGISNTFVASVKPALATQPLTYTWQASGQSQVIHANVQSVTDTVTFTWPTTGAQYVTVWAENAYGVISNTLDLTVITPVYFYLPMILSMQSPVALVLNADELNN
jgi:hypothetical protein